MTLIFSHWCSVYSVALRPGQSEFAIMHALLAGVIRRLSRAWPQRAMVICASVGLSMTPTAVCGCILLVGCCSWSPITTYAACHSTHTTTTHPVGNPADQPVYSRLLCCSVMSNANRNAGDMFPPY